MGSKKQSKKKRVWSCDYNCESNAKGTPCEHLEQILAKGKKETTFEGSHRRVDKPIDELYYTSGAGMILPEGISSGRYEAQFRNKLRKAGLTVLQIQILVETYVHNGTIQDITEELGLSSMSVTIRLKQEALRILREKGFNNR